MDVCFLLFIYLNVYLFIYFEREREGGRGRDREGERIPSRLRAVSAELGSGLDPTD